MNGIDLISISLNLPSSDKLGISEYLLFLASAIKEISVSAMMLLPTTWKHAMVHGCHSNPYRNK